MATLGQDLKRERELRGISLEDISDSTKISLKLLEALEQDRLDDLPGEFFIKAILRTYATSIGLEEDSFLNKYYEDSLLKEQLTEEKAQSNKIQQPLPKHIKKRIGLSMLAIAILAILIFVYLIAWKKSPSPPQEELQPSALIQQETPAALPEIEALSQPVFEEKQLLLEISIKEETWIEVYADGELKVDDTKQPGEMITVQASEELLINLGNAGGIAYKINNREGKPFGISGVQIRNIRITLENYLEFLVQELTESQTI